MTSVIGRGICRIRRDPMHSQSELEARARTSQSWIGRVETGSEISSLGGMARIAGALRIEAAELPCKHTGWDY